MVNARQHFSRLRSILEIPLATDAYWPKISKTSADGIMLDLEDSVQPDQKSEARQRVATICSDPSVTSGKITFVRVNGLTSEWGAADVSALGACPASVMVCYPKIENESELDQAQALLRANGPARKFYVMIESHLGLSRIERILSHPDVVGVHFGYSDYALDVGCDLFNAQGDGFEVPAMQIPLAAIGAAAAAYGKFASGGTLIPDFRDAAKVARFVRTWRAHGYSACIALMPSHLDLIHENVRHRAEDYQRATDLLAGGPASASFIDRRMAQLTVKQHVGY